MIYVLLVHRQELVELNQDPLEPVEVLFVSSSEEDLNREIDHHQSLGRQWTFNIATL